MPPETAATQPTHLKISALMPERQTEREREREKKSRGVVCVVRGIKFIIIIIAAGKPETFTALELPGGTRSSFW